MEKLNTKMKVPKDIELKIGTKKENLWTDYKNSCEERILSAEADIEIAKAGINLAEKKIKEEQNAH